MGLALILVIWKWLALRTGLGLWLTMAASRKVLAMDKETRERLCALGYINCGRHQ